MKERPILFSAPMVRAILEGRKTQTRRVIKPPKWATVDDIEVWPNNAVFVEDDNEASFWIECPYGKIGDRLWVRETWMPGTYGEVSCITYKADNKSIAIENTMEAADRWVSVRRKEEQWPELKPATWRPSIHMPRWASRIDLEITNVRVERLNDINEQDAIAEGIVIDIFNQGEPPKHGHFNCAGKYVPAFGEFDPARYKFFRLWESINGAGSWQQNPWVWVIEFKRIKP